MKRYKHFNLFCLLITALTLLNAPLRAANSPSIIRDTEIEATLQEWLEPIKKADGLENSQINIILLQSDAINAFVAGGKNIFIYTGLIEATKTPEELIGVMAHEMGHITGGHLITSASAMEKASYESIIGMVLGIGVAVLTGNGDAAQAVSAATNSYAAHSYLTHSRLNESSADQSAITAMDKAQINPEGMISFLKTMESEEYLPASRQTEYIRTHPITANRIRSLEERVEKSPYKGKDLPEKWYKDHARMKAKLIAYIDPTRVPWSYSDHDTSIPAAYARAIAAYRLNEVETAIKLTDELIKREPNNPYFQELKAQMLLEFGRVKESLPYYKKAIDLKPDAALIRADYAHALMESQPDKKDLQTAIDNLNIASKTERNSTNIHRLLATAYGQLGDENNTKIHLAEEAVLKNQFPYAKKLANEVIKNTDPQSKISLKAKDILTYIETKEKRAK